MCRIGRRDGRRPAEGEIRAQFPGVVAPVADQAAVGWQLPESVRRLLQCRRCSFGQAKAEQPSLTAGDVVDLCGSPTTGTADLLRSCSACPVNGGALNLDGSPIDGSPVIGGGRHHVAKVARQRPRPLQRLKRL